MVYMHRLQSFLTSFYFSGVGEGLSHGRVSSLITNYHDLATKKREKDAIAIPFFTIRIRLGRGRGIPVPIMLFSYLSRDTV